MVETPEAPQGKCPACGSEEIVYVHDDSTEWKCGRCNAWFAEPVRAEEPPKPKG